MKTNRQLAADLKIHKGLVRKEIDRYEAALKKLGQKYTG